MNSFIFNRSTHLSNKFQIKTLQIKFISTALFFCLLRNGVNFGGDGGSVVPALNNFPKPVNITSESLFPLFLLRSFGVRSLGSVCAVQFLATIIFLIFIFWKISNFQKKVRVAIASLVIVSPVSFELLNLIGIFDLYSIIGWCVFIFSRSRKAWLLGAMIVSFSNPAQVPITSILILFYSLINKSSIKQEKVIGIISISWVAFIGTEIWLISEKVPGFLSQHGGKSIFGVETKTFLLHSSYQFLSHLPNSAFSCYGIFWIPITLFVFSYTRWRRVVMLGVLIMVPLILSIVFVDGTRIFTNLVFPIAVLALISQFRHFLSQENIDLKRFWLIVPIFFPINYYYAGDFIRPFSGDLYLLKNILSHTSQCTSSVLGSAQQAVCSGINRFLY
jgi:hypothetical protein